MTSLISDGPLSELAVAGGGQCTGLLLMAPFRVVLCLYLRKT